MELDAVLLGLVLYLLLVGILVIINEAFCKSVCIRNASRIQEQHDVELNERKPTKPVITKPPKRNLGYGDAPYKSNRL